MFMPNSSSNYSRKPAAVANPVGTFDCAKLLRFAFKHGRLISIRAGGHNVTGSSLCDGGLVINMRHMNQTIVDPVAQTATTQGGTIWREFYEECYTARTLWSESLSKRVFKAEDSGNLRQMVDWPFVLAEASPPLHARGPFDIIYGNCLGEERMARVLKAMVSLRKLAIRW